MAPPSELDGAPGNADGAAADGAAGDGRREAAVSDVAGPDIRGDDSLSGGDHWYDDPNGWTRYTNGMDWLPAPCELWFGDPAKLVLPKLQVHDGPVIPISPPSPSEYPETWGDLAAMVNWEQESARTAAERHEQRQTAIAQLSTGKLWMMRAASSDRTPVQVWGLSDKYVYIAEGPAGSPYPSALVRLQIDKLDTINLP